MVNIGAVGNRWSNDILLTLNEGQKRFNQLMKLICNSNNQISTRTLADRLKKLEEEGLISREIIKGRPPTTAYQLTDKGKKTVELLIKLADL